MRVTVGTAMLLLALAACGQAADQGAGSGPPPAGSNTSSPAGSDSGSVLSPTINPPPAGTEPAPQGGTALPKAQVDTSALPTHYLERTVWSLNGGRTLVLYGMARTGCSGVSGRVVEQNADSVRIVLSPMNTAQGGPADGGGICTQVITPRPVTVGLTDPIGNRKVIVSEGP
jgi:hypothetical protein